MYNAKTEPKMEPKCNQKIIKKLISKKKNMEITEKHTDNGAKSVLKGNPKYVKKS